MARINERNNSEPQKLNANITFKEFVEIYWKPYAVKKNLQVSTLDHRNWILDLHLLPSFGSKLMRELEPADINKFLQMKARAEVNYSNNTLQAFYGVPRVMFDLAE